MKILIPYTSIKILLQFYIILWVKQAWSLDYPGVFIISVWFIKSAIFVTQILKIVIYKSKLLDFQDFASPCSAEAATRRRCLIANFLNQTLGFIDRLLDLINSCFLLKLCGQFDSLNISWLCNIHCIIELMLVSDTMNLSLSLDFPIYWRCYFFLEVIFPIVKENVALIPHYFYK